MDLVRIGDKVVSVERIARAAREILRLRAQGLSQQEVGERLGLDRAFVSRLESLGEVRRGRRAALVAFPVQNGEELVRVAEAAGVEYTLVWNDEERRRFLAERNGQELVAELFRLVARLSEFDVVVVVASDYWLGLGEMLLGERVLPVSLGPSPLGRDERVDPAALADLLAAALD